MKGSIISNDDFVRAGEEQTICRSIWLSDLHLGTPDTNSDYLIDFLKKHKSEYLYLVGDIIDLWQFKRGWYWPEKNNDLIRLILHRVQKGTKVIYIPGNHDDLFRKYANTSFNGVRILSEAIHETADGRKFLIRHGDEFDSISQYSRWLSVLGSLLYQTLLRVNRNFNFARRKCGLGYWSLSGFIKHKVKKAVNFISRFEKKVVEAVLSRGLDGLICGHIHHAAIQPVGNVLYGNIGDWVESCSAMLERCDGSLYVLRWTETRSVLHDERKLACSEVSNRKPAVCRSKRAIAAIAP